MSTRLERGTFASNGQQEQLYQVKLKGRQDPWIGTWAQLQKHPSWINYARPYVPPQPPASPHHAGFSAGIHPEDMPYQSAQLVTEEEQDDPFYGADFGGEPPRLPNSVATMRAVPGKPAQDVYEFHPGAVIPRRQSNRGAPTTNVSTYQQPAPQYAQDSYGQPVAPQPKRKRKWFLRMHPLMYLGLGMLAMLGLWQGYLAISTAWTLHQEDLQFGYPRTYQCDAVVGHEDSQSSPSHFIVVNLHGKVKIIELPAGDSKNAKIINGPQLYGNHPDLIPITVSFQTGAAHPSMVLHFQGGSITYQNEDINGVWQFVPPQNQ